MKQRNKKFRKVGQRVSQAVRRTVLLSKVPRIPFHRVGVNPKNYSFAKTSSWIYEDRIPKVYNHIGTATKIGQHLILLDGHGKPRFTLQYKFYPKENELIIFSIQRERTQYNKRIVTKWHPNIEEFEWNNVAETKNSKRFQKELGGMHPDEFLVSEFIWMNRDLIKKGAKVFLQKNYSDIYNPIRDRFFTKKIQPAKTFLAGYVLALEKKRTKRLIE